MKNNNKDKTGLFVAYTDASRRLRNYSSGAIILMPDSEAYLESVHIMSLGKTKKGIVHSEFRTAMEAMHIAPPNSLRALFLDCASAVSKLQDYQTNIYAAWGDDKLTKDEIQRLKEGFRLQPDVMIDYRARETDNIKIADKFSRMAYRMPEGVRALKIPQVPNLERQLEQLYPRCDVVQSLQGKQRYNKMGEYIRNWTQKTFMTPDPVT